MKRTTFAVIFGITIILIGTIVAVLFARGYNFDISKKELFSTGILVATSDPDGAEVLIDGKLKTATNNTINLAPGTYKVTIQKDGFTPWEKSIELKKEEVIKTNVFLFPALADLRPLTFSGAKNPTISTDSTKIVYGVASASSQLSLNPNGIWIIDMGRLFTPTPIFSSADFRQIYRNTTLLSLSDAEFTWSPDNKQILAKKPVAVYLLETDKLNDNPTDVSEKVSAILSDWQIAQKQKLDAQVARLPIQVRGIIASSSANISFSPDETKALYTASASAMLPTAITAYIPGKNPTSEIRNLKSGNTYVYDIKEDKNYLVNASRWFPSSKHLIGFSENQISIMEYDGTNNAVIYNGPYNKEAIFAWPNWSKMVILTSLGSTNGSENLYTVNFR